MPFNRPTLARLQGAIIADMESRLPGADAQLRRSLLNVLALAEAGAMHGLYGYQAFIANQILPDTAEAEFMERSASIWGLARKPARPAAGRVTMAGIDGATITQGTVLQRGDGVVYITGSEVTITQGTASVSVTASASGLVGNANEATTLTMVSPIAGVQSTASVAPGGLTQGSDAELDAELLDRLLARIRQPPHGGAHFDYKSWALDRDGHGLDVTRAWAYARELGPGTVTVRFMMDNTHANGIPQPADVQVVRAYIEANRPVTADVSVVAPVAVPLAFEIGGLNPATQAVKNAIEAELRDLIRREAEPASTLLISHIREAISIAAAEHDHILVTPTADVTHTTGQIATFGAITWS